MGDGEGMLERGGSPGHLFGTDERPFVLVDVFLVDFVCQEYDSFSVAELYEVCEVVLAQAGSGRISRIDEDQGLDLCVD